MCCALHVGDKPAGGARFPHEVGEVRSFGAVARCGLAVRAARFRYLRREGVKVLLRHRDTCSSIWQSSDESSSAIKGTKVSGCLQYSSAIYGQRPCCKTRGIVANRWETRFLVPTAGRGVVANRGKGRCCQQGEEELLPTRRTGVVVNKAERRCCQQGGEAMLPTGGRGRCCQQRRVLTR